ncbi:MAG TPA: alternative ribosome rescue aminoacyl-tRNA hydrolase ArfB [Pirellulales bacterium]
MLIITPQLRIADEELSFTFARSSGPGGQNVNKVNTKALLRWSVASSPSLPAEVRDRFLQRYGSQLTIAGEILIASQRFRDQRQNQRDCLEKLRAMLGSVAARPKRRKKTQPTRSSIERRRTEKRVHSQKKAQRRRFGTDD